MGLAAVGVAMPGMSAGPVATGLAVGAVCGVHDARIGQQQGPSHAGFESQPAVDKVDMSPLPAKELRVRPPSRQKCGANGGL